MQKMLLATPEKKFKCLEDRLLTSLYSQEMPVPLENLAHPISITTNAALSIVHRIQRSHPKFILVQEQGSGSPIMISANDAQAKKVKNFLQQGGYTRINEAEFVRYYKKELKKEKQLARWEHFKTAFKNQQKAIGTALLVGSGLLVSVFVYREKLNKK